MADISPGDPIRVLLVATDGLDGGSDRFEVRTVGTAEAALAHIADGDVDCVVSEHDLPDGTGLELLAAVREGNPDLPFILFTGAGSEELASEAIARGVSDYVPRGTDQAERLADRVEVAVGSHRTERDLAFVTALVEETGVGVAAYTDDGRYEYVNGAFAALLGRDRAAVVGEPIWAFNPGFDADRFPEYWASLSPGETRTAEAELERADGSRVPVETVTTCQEFGGEQYHFGTVIDRSDRAELEARLARETSMFESFLEQVPIGVYFKNEAGEHVRVSDHHVERLRGAWQTTPDGEPIDRETVIGRTDRELLPEDVAAQTAEDDMRVIREGETVTSEERHPTPGDLDVWVRTTKAPWYDEDGTVKGLIGVSIDISDRKRSELELERQNERLEEFASIISHDLRNPLNVAQGRLDLVRAECDSDHLDPVESALDRMDRLIERTLTLAREGQTVGETGSVALADLASRCWRNVETGGATLAAADAPAIDADPERLQHLLENLFRNSVEHGGPDVTITVGALDTGDGFYVADDGPGIPESKREDVLEAGVSGNEGGTGLGLAIVAQIAEA
ncbi:MAG: PAS domain-containing protein, partial [Halobacteriaceae archaeon]